MPLAAALVLLLAAPGAAALRVVTTTTDLQNLARAIGGERIQVESIGKGYQDPHFVEAKPSYILKLQKADLFVKVGLDLELWSQLLTEQARNPKIIPGAAGYVDASQGVEILQAPTGQVDRSQGDIHIYGNPHYWLDPANGKVVVQNILAGLLRVDPAGEVVYRRNAEALLARIDESIDRWEAFMAPYRGTKVVTYHNSWPNFAKRFGLEVVGYVEPKPGIPPSGAHIQSLIDLMKREGVRVIIMEPYFSRKTPELIAQQTGATLLVLPPSVGGAEGVASYFDLFDYDIKLITTALAAKGS